MFSQIYACIWSFIPQQMKHRLTIKICCNCYGKVFCADHLKKSFQLCSNLYEDDYKSTVYSKGQFSANYNNIVFHSTLYLLIMYIFCMACSGLRCNVFNEVLFCFLYRPPLSRTKPQLMALRISFFVDEETVGPFLFTTTSPIALSQSGLLIQLSKLL